MTLSADAPMTQELGDLNHTPVAASTTIYEGAMVGDNGSGYARALVAGDPFLGHAVKQADNSSGSAGAIDVEHLSGRYRLQVTLSGVAITDVGSDVYGSADDTYTLTAGSNSPAGKIVRYVSANTCIVEFATLSGGSIATADLADESVTVGKMADLAQGSLISGQASDRPTALDASGDGYILVGDGTDVNSVAVSGDVTLANTGAVTIAADAVDGTMVADDCLAGTHQAVVGDGGQGIPVIITKSWTDAATGDVEIYNANAPFKFRVIDAWLENQGANGANANSIQVCAAAAGANAITDAMSLNNKADTEIVRAASVDDSEGTVAASGSLYLRQVKAGGTMAGKAYIMAIRVS